MNVDSVELQKQKYLEFFTALKEFDCSGPGIFNGYRAGTRNYLKRDGGMTGIGYACSIGRHGGMIQVEFKYNSTGAKKDRLQNLVAKLTAEKEMISEKIGSDYIWESKDHAFTIKKAIFGYGTIESKDQWPTLIQKMSDEISLLRSVVGSHIVKHLPSLGVPVSVMSKEEQQSKTSNAMVLTDDTDRASDQNSSDAYQTDKGGDVTNAAVPEPFDPFDQTDRKEADRDSTFAYVE